MKKILAAALAVLTLSTTSFASTKGHKSSNNAPAVATVVSPVVPSSITFCGKKVDLDRADIFERFDRELTSMAYTHGNTLLTTKRAHNYFPQMAPVLTRNGVPQDLLYLACVESYLSNRAYSPAKAAGVWQFLASTAKQYGLEVSDEVDERYNLEKATDAAARMLKSLYNKYGDWATAMAAYNGGPARISSSLSSQLADNYHDLYLTEETQRYVYRIMAMKAVLENPAAFGFYIADPAQLYQPVDCDIVEVNGSVSSWPRWAKNHGITYAQLRDENPWIRSERLTNSSGKTYKVRVPKKGALLRSHQKAKAYNADWVR